MADVARCQEAIANHVLDAGQAISYRALASQVGGASAIHAQALTQFCKDNGDGVGAIHITVVKTTTSTSTDPRARVIRISTSAPAAQTAADACIYGVYPSASAENDDTTDSASVHEAMALALWAQERKVRNDLFAGRSRHQPLTRELKAFYDSDVQCLEATSRADMGNARGEEAISMFDSIKATTPIARLQSTTSAPKSSFLKNSSNSTSTSTASSSSKANSSTSFFKSSSNGAATSTKPKPKSTATASAKSHPQTETKRIDANAMNNVLSVDSDSDDDDDDCGAPTFVKQMTTATKSRATKRVMISDEEDADDEVEEVAAPPAKNKKAAPTTTTTRPSAKRKLSDSPEPAVSPMESDSPKRKRVEETTQDDEPQAEEDPLPIGPIKRRELVTKTVINDAGYMVTEKTYEEVEVSAEALAKERAEAKKKQAAAKAASDAQKARAAAAANTSKSTKASVGPAKQKKLDFFFARK